MAIKCNKRDVSNLPFVGYLNGLQGDQREALVREIKYKALVSDNMMWRYLNGISRPRGLYLYSIAKVVAEFSGDDSMTGEKLFPAEFYKVRQAN